MSAPSLTPNLTPDAPFGEAHAAVYDVQFQAMQAIKDCIHLLVEAHFAGLPERASILIAGAGTGAEVRYLAPRHPGWQFTLVDPSPAMLAIAQRHADAEGFAGRCRFYADYVSATPHEAHDASTSLLVSHFITDSPERQAYFADIAARLKPGGRLINMDLCTDREAPAFAPILQLWAELMRFAGQTDAGLEKYRQAFGRDFAVQGPEEVEALIGAAGFTPPAPVFQAGLIRGWTAYRQS